MSLAQSRGIKMEWNVRLRSVECGGGWSKAIEALDDVAAACGFKYFNSYTGAQSKKKGAAATRKAMEEFAYGPTKE